MAPLLRIHTAQDISWQRNGPNGNLTPNTRLAHHRCDNAGWDFVSFACKFYKAKFTGLKRRTPVKEKRGRCEARDRK
jgi:hypothetical protein